MKSLTTMLLISASTLLLGSCAGIAPKFYEPEENEIHDQTLGLTRDDYRKLPFTPDKTPNADAEYGGFQTVAVAKVGEPPIPDLAPILAAPPVPKLGQTKLVSIAVTDDVPLKDVLLELARLADVDIEVDASIAGGIAFRANQRPFNEVIERISDFAGLRYSMKNGVLRVERDLPFVEMYNLDFLNMDRSSSSSVNVSTSVLSGGVSGGSSESESSDSSSDSGSSGGGGGLTTGSSSSVTSSTTSDFWTQFESGIVGILAYSPQTRTSEFNTVQEQTASASAPGTTTAAPADAAAPAAPAPTPAAVAAATGGSSSSTPAASSAQYTINRQAGTLTVLATERQHRLVKEFIKKLEYNASAQVLIEAKIVEVTLDEAYEAGINWTEFGTRSLSASAAFGGVSDSTNVAQLNFMKNGLTGLDIDLNLAVALTQTFGTTRTLSSPRLHAINNQQAVLTFAKNEVYFNITIEREEEDTTTTSQTTYTVNSELRTVPIGIIMSILPSVNRDTGEITLNVRPTLSRVVDRVTDPQLAIATALDPALGDIEVENLIPVVEVRELDSILKVKSGQVMVIGGLMEDRAIQADNGVPGLSEVPVFGNLFKGVDRSKGTNELVIFIRATMVDSNGYSHEADKKLYDTYMQDSRPLKF